MHSWVLLTAEIGLGKPGSQNRIIFKSIHLLELVSEQKNVTTGFYNKRIVYFIDSRNAELMYISCRVFKARSICLKSIRIIRL